MSNLADLISREEAALRIIGHILVLLGIVCTGVAGVRIVQAVKKLGFFLQCILLLLGAWLCNALPIATGAAIYELHLLTGWLEFLVPDPVEPTGPTSRFEAVLELVRWIPFSLFCLYLLGAAILTLHRVFGFIYGLLRPSEQTLQEYRQMLEVAGTKVCSDRAIHAAGVGFAVVGVVVHMVIDAITS